MISPFTDEEFERGVTGSSHIPSVQQGQHQMLRGWISAPESQAQGTAPSTSGPLGSPAILANSGAAS